MPRPGPRRPSSETRPAPRVRPAPWLTRTFLPPRRPYLIDLESTNGTFINDFRIPSARYVELKLGDIVKFGSSTREYVLMNEESAG